MARKQDEHDPTLGLQITPVNIGGDSIADRLLPHIKKIVVGAVALAVILTGFFTWRWYHRSQQAKSTARVVKALALHDRDVTGDEPLRLDSLPPVDPPYASHAERDLATAEALAKAGEARSAAALYEANLLVRAGKLDQGLAALRKLANGSGDDAVLAREGVGLVLEMQAAAAPDDGARQKLLEEALAAFRAVQPDEGGLRRDYALYHEGRVLLDKLHKPTEAAAPLTKALEQFPETALRGAIENRLAAIGAPVPKTELTP